MGLWKTGRIVTRPIQYRQSYNSFKKVDNRLVSNSDTSFGTGLFRPTLEGDFFYNGFRGGVDTTLTAIVQKVSDQIALSKPEPQLVANLK